MANPFTIPAEEEPSESGGITGGDSDPTDDAGVVGDFYINRVSRVVFEKTAESTWAELGQFVPTTP